MAHWNFSKAIFGNCIIYRNAQILSVLSLHSQNYLYLYEVLDVNSAQSLTVGTEGMKICCFHFGTFECKNLQRPNFSQKCLEHPTFLLNKIYNVLNFQQKKVLNVQFKNFQNSLEPLQIQVIPIYWNCANFPNFHGTSMQTLIKSVTFR